MSFEPSGHVAFWADTDEWGGTPRLVLAERTEHVNQLRELEAVVSS